MRNVLVIDTETTGLEQGTHRIIEIGAALYDVENKGIVAQVSTLLPCMDNPQEALNRIRPELTEGLNDPGAPLQNSLKLIKDLSFFADALVAHNVPFDRKFLVGGQFVREDALWVDSMDLPFPHRLTPNDSLINLALSHGIAVVEAHRALPDVVRLCNLLGTLPDLSGSLRHASRPKGYFVSLESYPGADSKAQGFRWNSKDSPWDKNYPGKWLRWCFLDEVEEFPFGCRELKTS